MTRVDSTEFLPFARPSITDREKAAVLEVLDSGWLTTGARVKEFERRFAERVGVTHAVALNSATAALHLALEAIGVGPDDEVIVPTWTFAAIRRGRRIPGGAAGSGRHRPANAQRDPRGDARGGDPTDPRRQSRCTSPACRSRSRRSSSCSSREASPSWRTPPTRFRSRVGGPGGPYVGTVGRAGAYSFYATKTITTGEGGMLVTEDEAIADRATGDVPARHQPRCMEPLYGQRLLVLRDRGGWLQVQHDRHRCRARHSSSWTGPTSCSRRARSLRPPTERLRVPRGLTS